VQAGSGGVATQSELDTPGHTNDELVEHRYRNTRYGRRINAVLGGHHHLAANRRHQLPHVLLTGAVGVDVGRIDEVAALFDVVVKYALAFLEPCPPFLPPSSHPKIVR